MFETFEAAKVALEHDGWARETSYWYSKGTGADRLLLELDWDSDRESLWVASITRVDD